jgi:hypothetical protein
MVASDLHPRLFVERTSISLDSIGTHGTASTDNVGFIWHFGSQEISPSHIVSTDSCQRRRRKSFYHDGKARTSTPGTRPKFRAKSPRPISLVQQQCPVADKVIFLRQRFTSSRSDEEIHEPYTAKTTESVCGKPKSCNDAFGWGSCGTVAFGEQ